VTFQVVAKPSAIPATTVALLRSLIGGLYEPSL
jgi:hypothetical protein